jgi:ribosomal protein L44E
MGNRKNEFDDKIGASESEYCGICKKTTSQRWVRITKEDPEKNIFSSRHKHYYYYLRCKECGEEHLVYDEGGFPLD